MDAAASSSYLWAMTPAAAHPVPDASTDDPDTEDRAAHELQRAAVDAAATAASAGLGLRHRRRAPRGDDGGGRFAFGNIEQGFTLRVAQLNERAGNGPSDANILIAQMALERAQRRFVTQFSQCRRDLAAQDHVGPGQGRQERSARRRGLDRRRRIGQIFFVGLGWLGFRRQLGRSRRRRPVGATFFSARRGRFTLRL